VTTPSLTITNLTLTNNGDYVVVVANASGSVTSAPPANLTVASIIYRETFYMPKQNDQMVTNVGWIQDCGGTYGPARIFSKNAGSGNPVSFPICAVYTYDNTVAQTNAWYYTTASANGGPYDPLPGDGLGPVSNKMAFPGINLAVVQNLSYSVMANNGSGASQQMHWAVQMNNNQWYVSTNYFTQNGSAFQTFTMNFNPSAGAWNQLTVSGHCTFNNATANTNVVIGPTAPANLTGYVTGGGFVSEFTATGGNIQFNNYAVLGAIPPTPLPVINSPPVTQTNNTGTTATFTVSATTNGVTAGLTYQWLDGAVGSGIYSPLSNGGQFSGVTTPTLSITNVANPGNNKDYVVVVTDGAGSVTSTPPATLVISHSAPVLTADTFLYPDNANSLGSSSGLSITAGNNNVMNLTASFIGDLPISYQWQFSPDDGVTVSSVSGATNSTLTLSSPQTNASGYYRLSASNSQSVSPTNSDWVDLTIFPASTAQEQWSAKVPINGLTAAQILNGTPGTFFEAESFGGPALTVTNGTNLIIFDNTGASATLVGGYTDYGAGEFNGTTGDTNLDAILGADYECNSGNNGATTITMNNLTVSNLYSAQLFAFNDAAASGRQGNFADAINTADVSQSFTMGDNVYVVGTFTATNTTQIIALDGNSGCYMSAVIVRNAPSILPTPTLGIQWAGSNLQVSYTNGILLQATSLTGPWTTNNTASPYTFTPTGASMFFRTQAP